MSRFAPDRRPNSAALWTRRFVDPPPHTEGLLLVDFGSTYTKLTAVEAASGRLLGAAQHPTTVDGDLLQGFELARDAIVHMLKDVTFVETLACSSAGGGLRLAVVGLEPELSAEAARRAALNAGARVVTVVNHGLTNGNVAELTEARPDIILLAGGTNGGNTSALLESARVLAAHSIRVPIVLAGNEVAEPPAARMLEAAGLHVAVTPNLMPEIGVIQEAPVREAIRAIFIGHVIGGKHLSASSDLAGMVLMPTPDAVLTAAELLATGAAPKPGLGDLMVIDLGGATTDVHSVAHADEGGGYAQDLVADSAARRTVEADLGLRWNATGILEAAATELNKRDASHLRAAAERRVAHPRLVATSEPEMEVDLELARLAIEIATRRHAGRLTIELSPSGATLRKSGRDLRSICTIVLSGGIFRHADPDELEKLIPSLSSDGGLMVPQHPRFAVDRAYVLAAAGLLATRDRAAAFSLMNQELTYLPNSSNEGFQCSASS